MRRITKFFKFTLILFLVFSWVFNFMPINFGGQDRSQVLLPEKDFVGALSFEETRTVNIAEAVTTTTTITATTTPVKAIPEPIDETDEPDAISKHTDEIVIDAVVNEEEIDVAEEVSEPEIQTEPPSPPLSRRILERRVIVDKKATHSCEVETFRVDISGRDTVTVRVILMRDSSAPHEVEIGSLPDGVDITIAKNGAYRYAQGAEDRYLRLTIRNQEGSQKGNFTIPIIYTKKDGADSSTVCQMNIINI